MKKIILLTIFILLACNKKVDITKLNAINGYWQIQKVIDGNGNKKEYPVNENYEFFEIKNNKGFHKKVLWQPTGTFLVNNTIEAVNISNLNEKVILDFSSKFGKHTEELISISDTEMILKSKENYTYYYSKVTIDKKEHGKENK
jgi:hypothetical protein